VNSIKFPDFSCNWSRLSEPEDIRDREKASPDDGCYSFSVEVSQFNKMATPCHDPFENNFSHTEIRQLKEDEDIDSEPPKKRKLKSNNWNKVEKLKYRSHILKNKKIEIDIGQHLI